MSLSFLVYGVTLAAVYLYTSHRGSVGLLWMGLLVLLQALLAIVFQQQTIATILASAVAVLLVFYLSVHFRRDPFADARVFQCIARGIDRLSGWLARCGIQPKAKLVDARDNSCVRRIYAQLDAARYASAETQITNLSAGQRYQIIVGLADVHERPDWLHAWLKSKPRSAMALTVSGHQYLAAAWAARGTGFDYTVTPRGLEKFSALLATARTDLRLAIALDDSQVDPYVGMISIARGQSSERSVLWDLFAKARVLAESHYETHVSMVHALAEKWGGKPDEALNFARITVQKAGANSALVGVLAVAHVENWINLDLAGREYEAGMYFHGTSVLHELQQAYHRLDGESALNSDRVQALNVLAFCFYKGGQYALTRDIFRRLQGQYYEYPWQYCVEPVMATVNTAYAIDHVQRQFASNGT